ncbi:hypothetical protein BH11MYX1_BH11MYX1_41240 [soil metagenome]
MMNRAAVVATVLALSTSSLGVAFADEDAAPTTQTTTAQTLVVITPNAPVIVNNSGQAQAAAPQLSPPGAPQAAPAPDAAAPHPDAPHNEAWNNVSHINGSIVPVGERNAYLYAFKKNNVQTNPLAWMFGYYQIAGQHALSQNIAASIELSGWSTDHGNDSGYSVAATLPIYFKRTFSGPFLEPGLVIHNDSNSYGCYDCSYAGSSSASRTWAGPEMLLGWAWMFDSGLNISAAFGAAKRMSDSYSSSEPEPVGYFRVGYAF